MRITYFIDTDTILFNFNNKDIFETKDLDVDTLLDVDKDGQIVNITIEHAAQKTEIANFSFNQISAS
jgi:uncharacterized protein YuzE